MNCIEKPQSSTLASHNTSRAQLLKQQSDSNFSIFVDEISDLIVKLTNEGKDWKVTKQILDYFNNHNINSKEIYDWILNNQNNNSKALL